MGPEGLGPVVVLHFGADRDGAYIHEIPKQLSLASAGDLVRLPATGDLRLHCEQLAFGWDHALTVQEGTVLGRCSSVSTQRPSRSSLISSELSQRQAVIGVEAVGLLHQGLE